MHMDQPVVDSTYSSLLAAQYDDHGRARLLAASAPHSGDWLHALPISSCGLHLDNDAVRIAVGLRFGSVLCEQHVCPCGDADTWPVLQEKCRENTQTCL